MNLSKERINECLENGWTIEQINKGYDVFEVQGSKSVIDGALVVELIGDVGLFTSDFDACRQAEKDGIKFINDVYELEKGCYIDSPENRAHCLSMLEKHEEFKVSYLMKKSGEDSPYWTRYKNFFY